MRAAVFPGFGEDGLAVRALGPGAYRDERPAALRLHVDEALVGADAEQQLPPVRGGVLPLVHLVEIDIGLGSGHRALRGVVEDIVRDAASRERKAAAVFYVARVVAAAVMYRGAPVVVGQELIAQRGAQFGEGARLVYLPRGLEAVLVRELEIFRVYARLARPDLGVFLGRESAGGEAGPDALGEVLELLIGFVLRGIRRQHAHHVTPGEGGVLLLVAELPKAVRGGEAGHGERGGDGGRYEQRAAYAAGGAFRISHFFLLELCHDRLAHAPLVRAHGVGQGLYPGVGEQVGYFQLHITRLPS